MRQSPEHEVLMRVKHIFHVLLWALLGAPAAFAQTASTPYRLGPDDKLRIAVHEWRSARNEVYEWAALNGEFVVNAAGMVSLPLIGEVKAENLKTEELADFISERLQAKVGFAQRPDTAVEIIQYRPFYIVGVVNKPGDYPFRPGMSVLQAISIAGGFYRSGDAGLSRFERETIASNGELRVIAVEHLALLGRRARLQAELSGADAIAFPPELTDNPNRAAAAQVMKEEVDLFKSRKQSLASQLEALAQTKLLIQREVQALQAKDVTQERQLGLAKKDLDNVNSLISKGLSVAPRQLALDQAVAQIESARMDLALAIIRAEQDIGKTERDILALKNNRQNEVLTEVRIAQTKLQEYQERAETAQRLAYESDVVAPQLEEERVREELLQPVFTIVRKGPDGPVEARVSQTSAVQPGDIIKVERPRIARQFNGSPTSRLGVPGQGGPSASPASDKRSPSMPTFSMPAISAQNTIGLPGLRWPSFGSTTR
jgi:exopolysaccharide production protein ExoF